MVQYNRKKFMYHHEFFHCYHPGWKLAAGGIEWGKVPYVWLVWSCGRDPYQIVAAKTGLKKTVVKRVFESTLKLAARQVKKHHTFKLAGMLNMKLQKV